MKTLTRCVFLLLLFSYLPTYAQQTNVGNLTGTVTDPSGAIIPDVKVVAVNPATGIAQSTFTSSAGIYHVDGLQVGRYSVTVTKEGFQTEERTEIAVIAGQTFTVDFILRLGATSQKITVSAAPPVVNATDTMQGTTRTNAELQDLPISMEGNAEREAISAVQTLSGVNYNLQGNAGQGWMVVSRADINGVNGGGFGYEIDGVEAGPGEPEQAEDFMAPVPEAVQEIRMTSSTDASQGFNAGVNLALVTKSGTNQLHGDVFEFNRNAALESRNWFLPQIGKDNQNQYGWTLGGPVYIPHVYDGRNKTFFFATMDFFRWVTTSGTAAGLNVVDSVPTAAETAGDFSGLLGSQIGTDGLGRPIYQGEIYDPSTTTQLSNGTFVRNQFPGNIIPTARLSKVSQFFGSQYVAPTLPGVENNWVGPSSESYNPDEHFSVKIDQQIGDTHHVGFSLEREFGWFFPNHVKPPGCFGDHVRYSGYPTYTSPIIANSGSADCRDEYRYRLVYTWSARPDLLFSFRTGVTRDPKRNQLDLPAQLFNGACEAGLTGTLSCYTPTVNITNISPFGAQGGQFPEYDHSERVPTSMDVSWTKGKHLYSFGVQYVAANYIGVEYWRNHGAFNFSNNETGLPGTTEAPLVGAGYASFMLGAVDNASVGTTTSSDLITGEGALYAQDKWQVTPKLTVNYGLRWELTLPAHEHDNKISSFDPSIPNPGAGDILGALSVYGVGPGRNGMTQVGPYYLKAFAPKIGIAYAINSKTVFRAHYGVSYFPYWSKWLSSPGSYLPQDGFAQTISPTSTNSGITPAFYWDNGFPGTFATTFPVINPSLDNGQNITFVDTNNSRPPMVQNIGAEVERQLPGLILLRVAYVGNLTHHLYAQSNLDQLPLQYLSLGSLLNDSISSPAAVAAGIPVPFPGFTGTVAQALTPYPQYLAVNDVGGQLANDIYHSLQINVQRHFGSLTFLANATFSKEMDEASYPCGCWPANSTNLNVPRQIRQTAYALAGMDIPKQMNISWFWDLPVGKGKRLLGNASKVEDELLGSWKLSAIQSYRAGFPIGLSTTESIPSLEGVPPDLNQGVPIKAISGCGSYEPGVAGHDAYLNPAAFSNPAPFTLGNTFVLPTVRGCGYFDEDLGLSKSFVFGEQRRVEIGSLFTNLFNRHSFVGMNTTVSTPSFGQFSGDGNFARTVQLYMKVAF